MNLDTFIDVNEEFTANGGEAVQSSSSSRDRVEEVVQSRGSAVETELSDSSNNDNKIYQIS